MRSLVYKLSVLLIFILPLFAHADNCPFNKFELWSGKHLHGANIFMGRNPGGALNGIGDGNFAQSDFDDLRAAGANYIQLSHAGVFGQASPYSLDSVVEANLDTMIQRARNAGLYVAIAFRSGPGRNENAITNRGGALVESIWTDSSARTAWVAMMRHVADRYKNNPAVVGYSIMVEPNAYARHGFIGPVSFYAQYRNTLEDVNGLHSLATAAIRQVDQNIPILLEPEGYGNIAWLPYLTITGDSRTVYTPHDYTPFDYTHELVNGANYPGNYDADYDGDQDLVNKSYLTSFIGAVATFSQNHSVPVAITEFGVHRTAPNAATYLSDRIEIQNAIGSWAVWVWQPAGFIDPFSAHDASSVHNVLVSAWANNCTPIFEAPPGNDPEESPTPEPDSGTIAGNVRTRAGRLLKNVIVRAGAQTTKSDLNGNYSFALTEGGYMMRASKKKYSCVIGIQTGPRSLNVIVYPEIQTHVDIFCRKQVRPKSFTDINRQ